MCNRDKEGDYYCRTKIYIPFFLIKVERNTVVNRHVTLWESLINTYSMNDLSISNSSTIWWNLPAKSNASSNWIYYLYNFSKTKFGKLYFYFLLRFVSRMKLKKIAWRHWLILVLLRSAVILIFWAFQFIILALNPEYHHL